MKKWARRLLYFLLLLIWLAVMSFPIGAAILASRGQIEVGDEQSALYARLFLVQEREQEGIGLEWTRPSAAVNCRQGRIIYAMWEGASENALYCTCYAEGGSVIRSEPGACSVR